MEPDHIGPRTVEMCYRCPACCEYELLSHETELACNAAGDPSPRRIWIGTNKPAVLVVPPWCPAKAKEKS